MRKSGEYAKRMKTWWNQHKAAADVPDWVEQDPIAVLAIAVLSKNTTVQAAVDALARLRSDMVDFNELRVTPEPEIAELLGDRYPEAQVRASELCSALGYLFEKEHAVTLDRVADKAKKEQRNYLLSITGLDAYSVNVVLLHAFGHHAVPMDDDVLAALQTEDLLPRDTDLDEVNTWLERQVDKGESHRFWVVSKLWMTGGLDGSSAGSAARKGPRKAATKAKAKTKTKTKAKRTTKAKSA